jgi:iron complex outermembrane receptor protein
MLVSVKSLFLFLSNKVTNAVNAAVLGALLMASANVHAQVHEQAQTSDQEASLQKSGESQGRLKTVLVTADMEEPKTQHLEYLHQESQSGALGNKTILDTPFSIMVVDSKEIIERGAKSMGQIFVNDASVYATTPSSSTDWWGTQIRGLPVRNFYVDDVPMLLYWGGDFPTEAAESVTALKGLTGFMYGFGEPGGAISYAMKRPKEASETFINLGNRNQNLFSAHIDTSQNIGDEFAVRANLATEQGTAYNESDVDRTVASISIDKKFVDTINWFTNVVYEKNKLEGEPIQFYYSSYDVEESGGRLPKISYDYDKFNVDNSYYETETWNAATGLEWQINQDWMLKYKVGFSRKEHLSNKSFGYIENRAGDYTGYAYNFAGELDNLFNQVILQGNIVTGDVEHELVGGIGQQNSKERWGNFHWDNDFNGNLYQEQTFHITKAADFSLKPDPSFETNQFYAFASDTIHFNEQWQTLIGLRFTDYDLEDVDGDPTQDSGYNVEEITPTLALMYKPNDQTNFYASYVEGLEPGSIVGEIYANRGDMLEATVSKQYEVGIKHVSGKFNYTAAIFNIERANQMDTEKNGLRYLTQDGLETYKGAELSASYQFTDNLNIGLSSLYLDGTIDKISPENVALEGNDPSYASDWQFVGNFEYKVSGVQGLKLHGNARHYGESFTSSENTLVLPSRTLINAGASYDFKVQDRLWTLNANVNNLLNKKYWAGGGWSSGNMGEARNISVALNTTF